MPSPIYIYRIPYPLPLLNIYYHKRNLILILNPASHFLHPILSLSYLLHPAIYYHKARIVNLLKHLKRFVACPFILRHLAA